MSVLYVPFDEFFRDVDTFIANWYSPPEPEDDDDDRAPAPVPLPMGCIEIPESADPESLDIFITPSTQNLIYRYRSNAANYQNGATPDESGVVAAAILLVEALLEAIEDARLRRSVETWAECCPFCGDDLPVVQYLCEACVWGDDDE